ncbi:hypothetical protein CHARACLAT_029802 [Characodon lateralis]|uniref:Uncharacterized protein n=1 Tax=Characodon lateralis TaxID=208331 RepID=A0ABU7EXX5_9TELE|nr:hypothetical protein [Characodon lateralis]
MKIRSLSHRPSTGPVGPTYAEHASSGRRRRGKRDGILVTMKASRWSPEANIRSFWASWLLALLDLTRGSSPFSELLPPDCRLDHRRWTHCVFYPDFDLW